MAKAVIDTTVLVSAFLKPVPQGLSFALLRLAEQRKFELCVSREILDEVTGSLAGYERLRRRYKYSEATIAEYCESIENFATIIHDPPPVRGIVTRDPNDDMVVACALKAHAEFIISRDKDLLSLRRHRNIVMMTPEAFMHWLRNREKS